MTRVKNDGRGRLGGRTKGTPNKTTSAIKDCITNILEEYTNSNLFENDFQSLEPKERLMVAEKLMSYAIPKMQSVAVDDANKRNNNMMQMLISLRDNTDKSQYRLEDEE